MQDNACNGTSHMQSKCKGKEENHYKHRTIILPPFYSKQKCPDVELYYHVDNV